ncbi:hypothetical protein BOO69_05370 [Sulfitobacter alexandrii]|uniref:Surface lipoprotein assembly modifier C-terminal domain-containing protein n=1 Tax=Sulfitobacter alexandrii TaxID=1917485 RepID=A0A1J0WF23_9RHOB|nr:surface lipoprotein assembly modifier [Sulfitobacter alexandrii]APE42916.1 hypothetical protein BOO69_05370 [Sulfitobacter alexandrii]
MKRLVLSGILGLVLASAGGAQTTLDPDEARLAAARLLSTGQARAAAEITTVLIARDPQDAPSLIVHAHALRVLERYGPAQRAARDAWRATERDIEKYGAALAMAQALSSDGKKTRAQFWLRRAADVAPTARMRNRAVRDYQFVRTTNPWSVDVSFGINPSDNVNNAPRDNTFVLGGLIFTNPAAVPISGFSVTSDTTLRYNFGVTTTHRNFAALRWTESHVVFTDDNVPAGVDASDYAFRKLQARVGRDWTTGPDAPRQTIAFSFGQLWSGDRQFADEYEIEWRQAFQRDAGRSFAWEARLGHSDRKDAAIRSNNTYALGGRWSRPVATGDRLSWDARISRTDSDSRAIAHTRLDAGLQYAFSQPFMGAQALLSVSGELRQYDDPLYTPEARRDIKATVSGSLLFVDFDTYGFAPKLTLEASRTNSNVSRFETRNFGLNIGFQSLF